MSCPAPDRAWRHVSAALACCAVAAGAQATDFDELVLGDASNDPLAPSRLALSFEAGSNVPGSNVINGQIGRNASGVVDRDYFHVVVPEGYAWSSLRVGNQVTNGGSQGSFIGLAAGSSMPVLPTATSAAGLLGWTLYNTSQATIDILDDMALGHPVAGGLNGASGFTTPLPAGDYTLWIQETAPGAYRYRFNLVLSPVPEPSALLMFSLGLGSVLWRRRARSA